MKRCWRGPVVVGVLVWVAMLWGAVGAVAQPPQFHVVDGSPFDTGQAGPRSVAYSPTDGLLATANGTDRSVTVFKVDRQTGALPTKVTTTVPILALPDSCAPTSGCGVESVAFSPSGGLARGLRL